MPEEKPPPTSRADADPRARRSQAALEQALLDLVLDRELGQITVADVTKRAGLNRSTFYDHFPDVHALAASACAAMFDGLVAAAPKLGRYVVAQSDPPAETTRLFAHVAEHARLYRSLLGPDGSARLHDHLRHRMTVAIHVSGQHTSPDDGSPTHADDPADIPHDVPAAFIAGALLSVAADWVRRGCPGTPEELAATVWPLMVRASS
ncbi:TetR-like C-terminal domain-containing protein [Nonomuraea sp. NPDC050153]|uniref:TetR-like C-terminal domain-containing protein n=1 Tax=Nonomuraea sp. NPDC050153 TaxID=3364359 RepID=UPI003797A164